MLQITPQHRLLFAIEAVDFRKGIDGLKAVCQQKLNSDPFAGHLFVFRNRRGCSIKILVFDGGGFWLCQKRFSQGKLNWWPKDLSQASKIRAVEFLIMLQQGVPDLALVPPDWRVLFPATTEKTISK